MSLCVCFGGGRAGRARGWVVGCCVWGVSLVAGVSMRRHGAEQLQLTLKPPAFVRAMATPAHHLCPPPSPPPVPLVACA